MNKTVSLVLAATLSFSGTAFADSASADSNSQECALALGLSNAEWSNFLMFNAELSSLARDYGTDRFAGRLTAAIDTHWKQTRLIQISPGLRERSQNLLDMFILRDLIQRTLGLDHKDWLRFEEVYRDMVLFEQAGKNPGTVLEDVLISVLDALKTKVGRRSEVDVAEAALRLALMGNYLQQLRNLNQHVWQQRYEAQIKQLPMYAMEVVGGGLLISTFFISGPMVSTSGVIVNSLGRTWMLRALLSRLSGAIAAGPVAVVGAPGARLLIDGHDLLAEAQVRSLNGTPSGAATDYACELDRQLARWKPQAAQRLVSAGLFGLELAAAGGIATSIFSKGVLFLTSAGVIGVAQPYTLLKFRQKSVEAVGYYKLAEELEATGNHESALLALNQSRWSAKDSGDSLLEAIIVATLSVHISGHFREAYEVGEKAILKLYASSADTLPTAYKATADAKTSLGF